MTITPPSSWKAFVSHWIEHTLLRVGTEVSVWPYNVHCSAVNMPGVTDHLWRHFELILQHVPASFTYGDLESADKIDTI